LFLKIQANTSTQKVCSHSSQGEVLLIFLLIFTFYSDQLVIDVPTGIVTIFFYNIVNIIIIYVFDHGLSWWVGGGFEGRG
jgi:hypothetical protein